MTTVKEYLRGCPNARVQTLQVYDDAKNQGNKEFGPLHISVEER